VVRSADEIATMRRAGRVVAEMHARIREAIKPGVTTLELDRIGREVIEARGARSNFLGYGSPPFPGVICASPNDVVVHGIPDDRALEDGDLISIDCGAIVEGYHGDAAFSAVVGDADGEAEALIATAEAALAAAIGAMVGGNRLGDIGHAVEQVVERAGCAVVRELVGHGIGTAMHESPDVPNHGRPGRGLRLRTGHVLAVEPMITAGRPEIVLLDDGWTVVTADGSLAAHVEHTIAITDDGPQILTLP
jgi:methionyl aminopeptidase